MVIDGAVSSAGVPIECLGGGLQAGQCHVDVVLLHQEPNRVPHLHPALCVGRLAGRARLSECDADENPLVTEDVLGGRVV